MGWLALLLIFAGGIAGFLWVYYEYELYSNTTAIWLGVCGLLLFLLVLFFAYNHTWVYPPGERHRRLIDFLLLRDSMRSRLINLLVLSYLLVLWSLLALILNRLTNGNDNTRNR